MTDHPIGSPASNEMVRRNLAGHGDDGSVARTINHFGRPGPDDPAPIEEVVEDFGLSLSTFGFDVAAEEIDGEAWVVLIQKAPVLADTLDPWTDWLVQNLAQVGWIYDGWDCDVLRPAREGATENKETMT